MKKDEKDSPICVVGAGSWGTALANVFADAGSPVRIWGRDAQVIAAITSRHENPKYLKGIALNPSVEATSDLAAALQDCSLVACSIPTQQIRSVIGPHARKLDGKPVINSSKGIEIGSHRRVSEIFADLSPQSDYAVLSGPSFAEEVTNRLPTAVTIASRNQAVAERVQRLVSTPYFRAYTSDDVVGVELAGALKNVIAIASGMVNGLRLGYNAQAAVINRGIAEIARIGAGLGAKPITFLGLAGMGDLVLTCTGPLSRNRRVGVLLGEGKTLQQAQNALGGVAEGVFTAQAARQLAASAGIEMPILNEVHRILYEGRAPQDSVSALMGRDLKAETDFA